MLRIDALSTIYPLLKDRIVVTNMGAAAVELYSLGHRKGFFYMEHAMGLASSVGAAKPQMQKMTQMLLGLKEILKPDDVADAAAIALCHLRTQRFQARIS